MDDKPAYLSYLPWLAALVALSLAAVLYDAQVTAWLVCQTEGRPALEWAARLVTDWGNYVFYVGFGLALVVGLARKDTALVRLGLAYFLTLLLFSFLAVRLIKIGVGRPRPWVGADLPCRPVSFAARYHSFPSGHTSDAFAAVAPTWRWLRGRLIVAAVLALAFLIALTRIMLGQHYPTDIIVGAALSIGGGLLITSLLERWLPLDVDKRAGGEHA